MVYVGQTSPDKYMGLEATARGWGEMTVRGDVLPAKRSPWAFDNGAYRDWKADKPFNGPKFLAALGKVATSRPAPDFVVLPDIPTGGEESLHFSLLWYRKAWHLLKGQRCYLAVQDGMEPRDVAWLLGRRVAGIFVGGSNEWKLATGAGWVEFAHRCGCPCHIGRVGTPTKVRWALRIGADSIDSAFPIMAKRNLWRFIAALEGWQKEMFTWPSQTKRSPHSAPA